MRRTPVSDLRLTYPEVGATAGRLPPGYDHLTVARVVGHGEATFRRAAERLACWDVHRGAGLAVTATAPRAVAGARVLLRWGGRLVGATAACEVVYVVDEPRRQGFAYGSLEGHPEQGEERFCVQWHDDDTVELSITAFSRPARWWSRAARPVNRRVQRRITERYLHAL